MWNDKPALAVDASSPTSPFRGRVYVAWTRFEGCSYTTSPTSIHFTYSSDGGTTFSTDAVLDTPGSGIAFVQYSSLAVAPDRTVYVAWVEVGTTLSMSKVRMAKSTNGGASFTLFSDVQGITAAFAPTIPIQQIAADRTTPGLVYVAYSDFAADTGGKGEIKFTRSTNGGAAGSWSTPLTLNDIPDGQQFFPAMSTVAGRIDVIWYDGRSFSQGNKVDVFYDISSNQGQTFGTDLKINDRSMLTGGLGDYIGITSTSIDAYPVWTGQVIDSDTRDMVFDHILFLGGGGGGSVAYGTLITTAELVQIPVQNLRIGDQVLMYDVYTDSSLTATISEVRQVNVDNMLTIFTDNRLPLRVDANPRLKFYVWSSAGPILKPVTEFQPGDRLYGYDSRSWVSITQVQVSYGGIRTYFDLLTDPYLNFKGRYLSFIANGYADPCNPFCKEGPSP